MLSGCMVILLALTGLILIFLEFFLPGGIMAVGGGVLLASSLLVLAIRQPGFTVLTAYAGILVLALFIVIRLALSRVKKTGVCLDGDQEGFQACVYPKEMIGKTATVSSDLKPAGYVQIEDRAFAALSKSGYIEKGAQVRVLGGEGSSLIVAQETHTHVSHANR